jgi:hypothetical protein
MLGPEQDPSARIAIAGHGLVQNLRRRPYELGVEELATSAVAVPFDELAVVS